jgi:hypothetical protein
MSNHTRTAFVIEEYDADLEPLRQSDPFDTLAQAMADLRGRTRPAIYRWTMIGTVDEHDVFTVDRDDYETVWRSLDYNRTAKRIRLSWREEDDAL